MRLDAIEGSGVLPSFLIAVSRALRSFDVGARVAQAVRVPTLYDLYFSSPQRITVRALMQSASRSTPRSTRGGAWQQMAPTQALDTGGCARFAHDAQCDHLVSRQLRMDPANVGTERVAGVEARAVVAHGPFEVQTWSTIYRAQLRSGALRVPTPYVPTYAGGATARASRGPVQLSLASRWLGERPYTAGPRNNAFMLPAVALLDVAMSVRPRIGAADVLFTFAFDNVTNRAWQSVRGFPSPGRAWSAALTLTP